MLRRILAVSSVAALAVVAIATTAQAGAPAGDDGPDVATCAFNGNTSSLTTVLPTPNTGTYKFGGTAVCATADAADATNNHPPTDPSAIAATISSSGSYTNTKCGTGSATGTATLTDAAPEVGGNHAELPATISYTISFTNGNGLLTINGGTHADAAAGAAPASGTGAMQLSPNAADPDACLPVDVPHAGDPVTDVAGDAEAFAVTGTAVVTFPDK